MDREQYEHVEHFCNSFQNPAALLYGDLICAYCNRKNFIKENESIGKYTMEFIETPLLKPVKVLVMVNGVSYCAKITLLWSDYYFCEFIDVKELISISEHTNTGSSVVPMITSMSYNISSLWKQAGKLEDQFHNAGQVEDVEKILRMKRNITGLQSIVMNVTEYVNAVYGDNSSGPVDIYAITKSIVDRCNTRLSIVGRSIRLVDNGIDAFIESNNRHVIYIVASALQNALLYSPRDCVPIVSLSTVLEKSTRYVVLKVKNDTALFVNEKNGETVDMELSSQRIGFGIPMMKRFAEKCKGSFSIESNGSAVIIEIKIPEYTRDDPELNKVECSGFSFYDAGVPDYIDVMLEEVNNLYNYQ